MSDMTIGRWIRVNKTRSEIEIATFPAAWISQVSIASFASKNWSHHMNLSVCAEEEAGTGTVGRRCDCLRGKLQPKVTIG
jgi:hypothetical protein